MWAGEGGAEGKRVLASGRRNAGENKMAFGSKMLHMI
jgi:hypothetical protein